jgi:EVE domain
MSTFLKLIGSGKNPCPEPYEEKYVDFSRRPHQINPGDYLVLYAAGGRKRVFAIAKVISGVYPAAGGDAERWPYRVDISYQVNLHPSAGVHIDEVSTTKRDLVRSLMRQSYLKLSPEEYERAETKLNEVSDTQ